MCPVVTFYNFYLRGHMDKIYDGQLREILDQLYLTTAVAVPWASIYMWFGTQKIAKAPYRHIQKEWELVCESHTRVWPERTDPVSISMVENAGFNGLVIQRALFDDEKLVVFDKLTA